MMTRRKSKLDRFSIGALVVSIVLFAVASILYVIAASYSAIEGRPLIVPISVVANWFGVIGMITVPVFVVSAIIQNWRENRRDR